MLFMNLLKTHFQVGSVVKAAEEPPSAPEASVTQIAKNSNKVRPQENIARSIKLLPF